MPQRGARETVPWPAMIEMDRAAKAKVDALWAKLGQ